MGAARRGGGAGAGRATGLGGATVRAAGATGIEASPST